MVGIMIPATAAEARAQGFDFATGYIKIENDEFTAPDKMTRRGQVEVQDGHGNRIVLPFVAHYKFASPRKAS